MSNQEVYINKKLKNKIAVVLIQPDIPQNTGNIARLCMAVDAELVLVRPLGFKLTDSNFLRAGMDYWLALNPIILNDLEEFYEWIQDKRVYFLSAHANKPYAKIKYQEGDVLVFGSESQGLPPDLFNWAKEKDALITLPMIKDARCINVSSSVAAVVYEALNQIHNWNG